MRVQDKGGFTEGLVFWLQQGTDSKALFLIFFEHSMVLYGTILSKTLERQYCMKWGRLRYRTILVREESIGSMNCTILLKESF